MFRILFAVVSMFVFPQNSYFETLILNVLVLGEKVFGKWSGREGGALVNKVSAFIKGIPDSSLAPSTT